MARPRILVTFEGEPTLDQWGAYSQAVYRAGGEPVAYDAGGGESLPSLARYDGLLTTGGDDVDAARYGEPRDAHADPPSHARDEAELALTRLALDGGVPLLAICRGEQLLNVACGGSLLQHLAEVEPHRPRSTDGGATYESGWHEVRVTDGTLLARISGVTRLRVNSRHHQAVTPDRLAAGLLATAHADEGEVTVVEAIEVPGHPFALGVQWHPERHEMVNVTALRPGSMHLFEAFVAACHIGRDAARTRARPS